MGGEARRKEILNHIIKSEKPVSGTKLAEIFQVSRQVIVQDIALLRAADFDILSTNRGYICCHVLKNIPGFFSFVIRMTNRRRTEYCGRLWWNSRRCLCAA